jgi:CheY-like chemotaxis protein
MTKIMLVEDDNNLREIYEARLLAEGYEIVSAKDGEEALALAVKEKPDLIITDVMMPKISGFDMLDILRSTPETKDTKVIMMTALSQAEDKTRADKLGADRYLVKSQVTLEDVAKVAREVLAGEPEAGNVITPAAAAVPDAAATTPVTDAPAPVTDAPAQAPASDNPAPAPDAPVASPTPVMPPAPAPAVDATSTADETATVVTQINDFVANTTDATVSTPTDSPAAPAPEPVTTAAASAAPAGETSNDKLAEAVKEITEQDANGKPADTEANSATPDNNNVNVTGKKRIEPINDVTKAGSDIADLAAAEAAKEAQSTEVDPGNPPAEAIVQPSGATLAPAYNDVSSAAASTDTPADLAL